MIRNLVLGLVLAASAGVQGLYAQRYPERRVLRAGNALYEQENYPCLLYTSPSPRDS